MHVPHKEQGPSNERPSTDTVDDSYGIHLNDLPFHITIVSVCEMLGVHQHNITGIIQPKPKDDNPPPFAMIFFNDKSIPQRLLLDHPYRRVTRPVFVPGQVSTGILSLHKLNRNKLLRLDIKAGCSLEEDGYRAALIDRLQGTPQDGVSVSATAHSPGTQVVSFPTRDMVCTAWRELGTERVSCGLTDVRYFDNRSEFQCVLFINFNSQIPSKATFTIDQMSNFYRAVSANFSPFSPDRLELHVSQEKLTGFGHLHFEESESGERSATVCLKAFLANPTLFHAELSMFVENELVKKVISFSMQFDKRHARKQAQNPLPQAQQPPLPQRQFQQSITFLPKNQLLPDPVPSPLYLTPTQPQSLHDSSDYPQSLPQNLNHLTFHPTPNFNLPMNQHVSRNTSRHTNPLTYQSRSLSKRPSSPPLQPSCSHATSPPLIYQSTDPLLPNPPPIAKHPLPDSLSSSNSSLISSNISELSLNENSPPLDDREQDLDEEYIDMQLSDSPLPFDADQPKYELNTDDPDAFREKDIESDDNYLHDIHSSSPRFPSSATSPYSLYNGGSSRTSSPPISPSFSSFDSFMLSYSGDSSSSHADSLTSSGWLIDSPFDSTFHQDHDIADI
ncbi:hypothetical protein BLNAU_6757 [Blattamonas nauphoetae]|uniref:Uncharacterized protein n=1 Tax=Blattamonas nauphoetae TaxID=2049346 RepID=A0ABQ9Y3E4_9EUKA|nr:hypothetical protein BLNAU_6757 [Blattamonas nauphoetae]